MFACWPNMSIIFLLYKRNRKLAFCPICSCKALGGCQKTCEVYRSTPFSLHLSFCLPSNSTDHRQNSTLNCSSLINTSPACFNTAHSMHMFSICFYSVMKQTIVFWYIINYFWYIFIYFWINESILSAFLWNGFIIFVLLNANLLICRNY